MLQNIEWLQLRASVSQNFNEHTQNCWLVTAISGFMNQIECGCNSLFVVQIQEYSNPYEWMMSSVGWDIFVESLTKVNKTQCTEREHDKATDLLDREHIRVLSIHGPFHMTWNLWMTIAYTHNEAFIITHSRASLNHHETLLFGIIQIQRLKITNSVEFITFKRQKKMICLKQIC